jgi:hypothetical protein
VGIKNKDTDSSSSTNSNLWQAILNEVA